MYALMLLAFFVVLPLASILIELAVRRRRPEKRTLRIIARWFTFWIVGVRLFLAGAMQALNPSFTAEDIFGTTSPDVLPFVAELGYANLAFGVIGIVSVFRSTWVTPAATAGAVFLGLDGLRHLIEGGDFTFERTLAMITDLIALVVLGGLSILRALDDRKRRIATGSV